MKSHSSILSRILCRYYRFVEPLPEVPQLERDGGDLLADLGELVFQSLEPPLQALVSVSAPGELLGDGQPRVGGRRYVRGPGFLADPVSFALFHAKGEL